MNSPATLHSLPRSSWPRIVFILVLLINAATSRGAPPNGAASRSAAFLSHAPLYFEANDHPADDAARFIARGRDCDVLLNPTEALLLLGQPGAAAALNLPGATPDENQVPARTIRLSLPGANVRGKMTGLEQLPGKANYLIGNDPAAWRTGLPLFAKVKVEGIYPGIDLVYYADASARLEYDFVLQPDARADQISFNLEGADQVRLDAAGNLVLQVGADEIQQHRPVIYQNVRGQRQPVAGGYRLTGKSQVAFWVGKYDHTLPLVIDPTLSFSTFLGGSKADVGQSIAVDGGSGNIYVAGQTVSKKFATPGAFQTNYNGGIGLFGDAFVAKYDGVSNGLVYVTYLGGKTDDGALGIFATNDNAYVTGFTDSRNFPIVPTNGALRFQLTGNSNNSFRITPVDAFVAELDSSGSNLVFSTLLGGSLRDSGYSIAVDGSGVYVAGYTESSNFIPTPNGLQTTFGGNVDAFVVKIVGGTNCLYSTFLGGTNLDYATSLALDSSGNAYLTGFTDSTNFPMASVIVLTNAVFTNGLALGNLNGETNFSVFSDAFISKLSTTTNSPTLFYSSYLGGSNNDAGLRIALDSSDNAYVTGYTFSPDFPTNVITAIPLPPDVGIFYTNITKAKAPPDFTLFPTNATVLSTNFLSHVFVTKVDPNGQIVYSTQFGGSGMDQGTGIAVDNATANAYVAGYTSSGNFFPTNIYVFTTPTNFYHTNNPVVTDFRAPPTNSLGKKIKVTGPNDSFLVVLGPQGTNFIDSIWLGGSGNDQANDLVLDPSLNAAYLVGTTTSPNLPVTNSISTNLVQMQLDGIKKGKVSDAFIEKILFP